MNVTFYEHKAYRNLRLPGLRKNKPNPNSQPVALPVRCSRDGIAYFPVSNLVFRASNLFRISILGFRASTQFMQNKPNSQKPKINLTSYGNTDYEHVPPLRTPKKQTQFRNHCFLRTTVRTFSHGSNHKNPGRYRRRKSMETQDVPQRPIKNKAAGFFLPNMLYRSCFQC
jgi:hypothetical protein